MPKESAGLLMYRRGESGLQFLLVHPGGPFWQHKDQGAWTIPKGEIQPAEPPLAAARREFQEELGIPAEGTFRPLQSVRQKGGKIVHAWAFEGDCDPSQIRSNTFTVELPAGSGRFREFPEIDRAGFFSYNVALEKINPAQAAFLHEANQMVALP
jgi:predicted NUDIX family NTP pyrophosphohydrolase